MRTTAELREGFLSFFEAKGHLRHPSGSLIPPEWDRSTLLTSAGMQPLMPFFLGKEAPQAPLLTTAQKCFRTPDIEEVGTDGYHLTFFEMMGNFSFGEYFKENAVELAWEFVTEHMKIDLDRFWVTVFAGDPELGLGEDETAVRLWEQVGVPPDRIRRLGRADNFWSVGGPGPCGPDTELFYDRGDALSCGRSDCAPGCSCERYLEFWNLVFMEYELHADGTVTPLPKQNVDTGLGLERAATILQDVVSVYETDGYQAIMDWIATQSGVAYGESDRATKAHRILADHGRGMTLLAADGVTPSNEGRGYILRRIVRRAVQQAQVVGLEQLWPLTDVVADQMGRWYPELEQNRAVVQDAIRAEEELFSETLSRGMQEFGKLPPDESVSAEDAFKLAATYGFPIELTAELAEERGQAVDIDGYREQMEQHREISRAGGERSEVQRAAEFAQAADFTTEFVGYRKTDVLTQIGALEEVGDWLFLAKLRESPFYPEGGGQVSDQGVLLHEGSGAEAELLDAYRLGDDQALLFSGEGFAAGDRVRAVVPWSVRFPTMANHTATHVLHQALRQVLGEHVRQAGSAVRPDKLRFDFTHPKALTLEERTEVDRLVNEQVFRNLPVLIYETPIEEARSLGAMMLFGEKYGDEVRVVEIQGWSLELCGGTHVRWTAEIGPFVILAESSVGAGARRIEAVTSGEAYAYLHGRSREADELRGELERARKEQAKPVTQVAVDVDAEVKTVGGVSVIAQAVEGLDADSLLALSDRFKQRNAPAAVVLGTSENGTVHLVANFDQSVADRVSASEVVKVAAALVGGGGGGRPTMARAGGREPEKLTEAIAEAERLIVGALSA
jgi:alanyl-tRNA synthetase